MSVVANSADFVYTGLSWNFSWRINIFSLSFSTILFCFFSFVSGFDDVDDDVVEMDENAEHPDVDVVEMDENAEHPDDDSDSASEEESTSDCWTE